MPSILEFKVLQPPTSGELQEQALEALKTSGLLKIVLLGEQQLPKPQATPMTFRIAQTIHPEDGGMIISGMVEDNEAESVVVRAPEDPSLPAAASVVTAG